MKILITINSLMYNRGSEAVLRSIVKVCREIRSNSYITVVSGEAGEVFKKVDGVDKIVPKYDSQGGMSFLISEAKEADVIFVTGADNYDSINGNPTMKPVNDVIFRVAKGKTILYDCSLEENNIIDKTIEDIKRFTFITTRETKTYHCFCEKLPANKVFLYPDPAFILPIEECTLPWGFEENNMVGINVSNLILGGRFGADRDTILHAYRKLIDSILNETTYTIILVQHILNNGYDWEAISELYKGYEDEKRVIRMKTEHLNCMQIKYIISKLRFLITARTHAAIAAYSSCVPVLAVSYSIKSIGIANDIMGSENPYVIKVNELSDEDVLVNGFRMLNSNENKIIERLHQGIPDIKQKVYGLEELL